MQNEKYSVRGSVESSSGKVSGALVSIGTTHKALTDNNVNFLLIDVPFGNQLLTITYNVDTGSYVQNISSINIFSDTILSNLILPAPVRLYKIDSTTATSLKITWTASTAGDFREYKIFKHSTAGLDEKTGTLINVTTSRLDISFIDSELTPSCTYFYRIFVMNNYGIIAGSNIVTGITQPADLVLNGSFEQYDDQAMRLNNWDQFWPGDSVNLDSTCAQDGNTSVRLFFGSPNQQVKQHLDVSNINTKLTYWFTFWDKLDTLQDNETFRVGIIRHITTGINSYGDIQLVGPKGKSDWKQYRFDVTFPESIYNESPVLEIETYMPGIIAVPHKGLLWVDNITLYPKN